MAKMFSILLAQNASAPFLPMHVVVDFPTVTLIPSLVKQLHLPEQDAAGQSLSYTLVKVDQDEVIPPQATLLEVGVHPGARLRLQAVSDIYMQSARLSYAAKKDKRTQDVRHFLGWAGRVFAHAFTPAPLQFFAAYTVHQGRVGKLAWSPDSMVLASGDETGQLSLWNSQQQSAQTCSLTQAVSTIAWSEHTRQIAVGAGDTVFLFDGASGEMQGYYPKVHTPHICDFHWITALQAKEGYAYHAISIGWDGSVMLWNTTTTKAYMPLTQPLGRIRWSIYPVPRQCVSSAVSVSPDCAYLYVVSLQGKVYQWNLTTNQQSYYLQNEHALHTISVSAKTGQMVVGDDDGRLHIWNAALFNSDEEGVRRQQSAGTEYLRLGHLFHGAIKVVRWSPDSTIVAIGSSDGFLRLWRPGEAKPFYRKYVHGAISDVSWSPDKKFLAAAVNNTVMVWRVCPDLLSCFTIRHTV